MGVKPYRPNYDAAYPHCVMISPRNVPGGPWPDNPWLYPATLLQDWDDQIMMIRAWCETNLQGPWVLLNGILYLRPRIYTQLEEDHTLVELAWS